MVRGRLRCGNILLFGVLTEIMNEKIEQLWINQRISKMVLYGMRQKKIPRSNWDILNCVYIFALLQLVVFYSQ